MFLLILPIVTEKELQVLNKQVGHLILLSILKRKPCFICRFRWLLNSKGVEGTVRQVGLHWNRLVYVHVKM
jgi:hypothetical protein